MKSEFIYFRYLGYENVFYVSHGMLLDERTDHITFQLHNLY